jgi:hypothetical protein
MAVVASSTFADVVSTNCGVDSDGFDEYLDNSCSAATREV